MSKVVADLRADVLMEVQLLSAICKCIEFDDDEENEGIADGSRNLHHPVREKSPHLVLNSLQLLILFI